MILGDNSNYFQIGPVVPYLMQIIYICSTCLLVIIMLNLIISVLSGTYGDVQGKRQIASNYERTVLLQEIDEIVPKSFVRRLEKSEIFSKYLFLMKSKSNTSEIQEKIKMKSSIN